MEEQWRTMDRACKDAEYMAELYKIRDEEQLGLLRPEKTCFPSFLRRVFPLAFSKRKQFQDDLVLFDGLRRDFILERSAEVPFEPSENRVPDDFNFGRYLSICLGNTLEHIVDVECTTWTFFVFLTIAYYCIFLVLSLDEWVSSMDGNFVSER